MSNYFNVWERFDSFRQKTPDQFEGAEKIDLSLSFITHAMGICLIHRPEIKNEFNLSNNEDFVVKFIKTLNQHNLIQDHHILKNEKPIYSKWTLEEFTITVNNDHYQDPKDQKLFRDDKVLFENERISPYYELLNDREVLNAKDLLLENRIDIMKCIKNEKITEKVVQFWYLIFGCEVIKNPAALIHINMALDLVAEKILNFEQLNKIVPMMKSKNLAPVMMLYSLYANFMPFAYKYNDPKASPEKNGDPIEVIQHEAQIIKKWLKLKLGENFNENQEINDNFILSVWRLIKNSLKEWNLNELLRNNIYLEKDLDDSNENINKNDIQRQLISLNNEISSRQQ